MFLFHSLVAIVLLSPLPYGANRPWSWSLCSLLFAVLGIVWALQCLLTQEQTPLFRRIKPIVDVVVVFFIVVIWAIVQTSTQVFADWQHPLWQMQQTLIPSSTSAISLTPSDTITVVMRLTSYALVFWLALCFCQDPVRARRVIYGLMLAGLAYSVYGLVMFLGDFQKDTPYFGNVVGTFINRNHFATFAGLTLICTLAILNDSISAAAKYHIGGNLGLQRFIEKLIIRAYLPLSIFFVIGTALLLSHSRGGFTSSLLALIVFIAALNANKHSKNLYLVWILSVFIVIGSIVFLVSSDGLMDRLDTQGFTDEARDEVYELTWNAIMTNPWLGFGLGSFEEVFPLYKSLKVAGSTATPSLWDFAHNSYLENIFELGFPAALGLCYCVLRLGIICVIGIMTRKRDWIYPAAGVAATSLIGAHAYVDFSMQIPAVTYTYLLLMGAACAQSFSSRKQTARAEGLSQSALS